MISNTWLISPEFKLGRSHASDSKSQFVFGRLLPTLAHPQVSRWLHESSYAKQNCLSVFTVSHLKQWKFQNDNYTLAAFISGTTTLIHFLRIFSDTDALPTHTERNRAFPVTYIAYSFACLSSSWSFMIRNTASGLDDFFIKNYQLANR